MHISCFTPPGYQWDYVFDWTILKHNAVPRGPKRSDGGGPPPAAQQWAADQEGVPPIQIQETRPNRNFDF